MRDDVEGRYCAECGQLFLLDRLERVEGKIDRLMPLAELLEHVAPEDGSAPGLLGLLAALRRT